MGFESPFTISVRIVLLETTSANNLCLSLAQLIDLLAKEKFYAEPSNTPCLSLSPFATAKKGTHIKVSEPGCSLLNGMVSSQLGGG